VPHPPHADLAALIETLLAANVEFIVVGGAAAVLHGAPTTTLDLDIVHSRADANVDRLATVLRELEAVYRDPAGRRIEPTKQDLAGSGQLNLSTKLGPLDPLCQLHDGRGYDELLAHTTVLQDGALRIRLLDLPTLIEIKSSTGRAKDLMIVPLLGALLDDAGE
jgi:hypothetical protein